MAGIVAMFSSTKARDHSKHDHACHMAGRAEVPVEPKHRQFYAQAQSLPVEAGHSVETKPPIQLQ
jgi:hypothetical protein